MFGVYLLVVRQAVKMPQVFHRTSRLSQKDAITCFNVQCTVKSSWNAETCKKGKATFFLNNEKRREKELLIRRVGTKIQKNIP